MGLFQKKPSYETSAPLYNLDLLNKGKGSGLENLLLIVGLGNKGRKYENTRHNAGFMIIDHFADKHEFPAWSEKKDLKCQLTTRKLANNKIILIKPTTYMNASGEAVQAVQHFYKIDNSKTIAIYDELDIRFGHIRTRTGGTSAGHNGVKSIIAHCGEDFGRIRVGIGPKNPARISSEDFVLAGFSEHQRDNLKLLFQEANSILSEYVFGSGDLPAETRSFLL